MEERDSENNIMLILIQWLVLTFIVISNTVYMQCSTG